MPLNGLSVTDADTFRLARGGRELLLNHPTSFSNPAIPDRHTESTFRSRRIFAFFRAFAKRPYAMPHAYGSRH